MASFCKFLSKTQTESPISTQFLLIALKETCTSNLWKTYFGWTKNIFWKTWYRKNEQWQKMILLNLESFRSNIYLYKVNNRNTTKRCEICSKLTIKNPERRHWRASGVFIVNSEHISQLSLVFLLFTLNR